MEPELSLENPGYIPEHYIPDVGQRLQFYKQLASAVSEEEAERIAAVLNDRFGPLPEETEALVAGMVAKALCRHLSIRGLEVTSRGLTLHLMVDSKVNPDRVLDLIREDRGRIRLTEDLKIKVKFDDTETDTTKSAIRFLHRLDSYDNNLSIS
jgi:transcription-repair coupling factor (superfamily II helicase)